MIAYLARTLPVLFRARLQSDGSLVSRIQRRVHPSHIDINLHMNQSVYAQSIELGRADWLFRSGAWPKWRAAQVNPVVAEQTIVYRRELRPLAKYTIETRAVGIEGRLLLTENHLLVGENVHAKADVKLIFVGPNGVLSGDEVKALCNEFVVSPLAVENWKVVRDAE